ncbi:hypothetical protein ABT340_35655 [Streptosporangium sp. NPDC000239]|uniref:hypothetical protein n=1 Tax=Streptosporangium sp. NPDC000239 TaxID=3154248 RepID=UPI0033319E2A
MTTLPPDFDVNEKTRAQLIEHIDECDECGSDDPQERESTRDASLSDDELRDYITTAHDERWLEIAGRGQQ